MQGEDPESAGSESETEADVLEKNPSPPAKEKLDKSLTKPR